MPVDAKSRPDQLPGEPILPVAIPRIHEDEMSRPLPPYVMQICVYMIYTAETP